MKKLFLTTTLLSLSLLFTSAQPALAKSFSLAVSPPVTEVITRPGTTIEIPLTVTNHSETLKLSVFPQLVIPTDSLGHVTATPDKSEVLTWLSIAEPVTQTGTYQLATGQPTQFTLVLKVPAHAPDSDHQLAIFFQSTTPTASDQTGTGQLGRLASLLLLTVSSQETIESSALIDALSVPRLVDSFSPLPVTLLVKNTGPHFTKLAGSLSLTNDLTHSRSTTPLTPTNILASADRYLLASPSANLTSPSSSTPPTNQPPSTSPLTRLLSYLPASSILPASRHRTTPPQIELVKPPFLFGPYTLSADLYPVDATGNLTASTYFFAFPYKLLIFLSLLSLLAYLLLRSNLKYYMHS